MLSHVVKGPLENSAEKALTACTLSALKDYKDGMQALHLIVASLILVRGKYWRAVISVVQVPDIDGIYDGAITFAHLPEKYREHYDAMAELVDHVNVIEDASIWTNIKLYLLDVYFYQAVHFGLLNRIKETGGGYFQQDRLVHEIEPDVITLMLDYIPIDGTSYAMQIKLAHIPNLSLNGREKLGIKAAAAMVENKFDSAAIAKAKFTPETYRRIREVVEKRQHRKERLLHHEHRLGSTKIHKLMTEMGYRYDNLTIS